ncbi:MAG: TonB-dependent receptor, partial [Steroidobacteraceae bacterium]
LSENVGFRLSGGHEEQDGYVKVRPSGRELGGTDVDYVRGALRIEPTEALSLDLAVRHEESSSPNAWQQLLTPTVFPTPGQTTKPNRIIADQPYDQESHTTVASVTANWDITQGLTLRSISSYVDHDSAVDVDADTTDLDGFNALDFRRPSESYGQEFNLLGETGKLKWILGAYYFHEDATIRLPVRLGSVFAPAFGVPVDTELTESVKSDTDTYAAFADLTYSLTERLRLNLGLRYNHETKDFEQLSGLAIPGVGFVPIAAAYANGAISTDTKSNKVLPKVGVQFDLADNVSSYAQWSKGFKSGGQNLEGGTGATIGEDGLYRSESIDAYEVGLKSQWLDRALTANFAAFYYDYSNLQATITIPPTTTLVQNADAKIYGLESELEWRVSSQLRLNLAATLTHARFDDFVALDDANPGAGQQNLDGEPLPHAPDYTVNAGAQYSIPLNTAWFSSLSLRADVNYSDDVVLRYFGTANDTQDSYVLGSVSAKLGGATDKTTIRFFVNNVGDEEYLQNVIYIGAVGAYMGNYGLPRTWGLQLTRKFF